MPDSGPDKGRPVARSELTRTLARHLPTILDRVVNPAFDGRLGTSRCHHLTLLGVALSVGARNILELGHHTGESTLPFLLAASLHGGNVTSVDLDRTMYVPPVALQGLWTFQQRNTLDFLRDGRTRPPHGWDLVFIDDWHAATHVKLELDLLANQTRLDTVFLLHDTMTSANMHGRHQDDPATQSLRADGGFARYNPRGISSSFDAFATGYEWFDGLDSAQWEKATVPSCFGLTLLRRKECWSLEGWAPDRLGLIEGSRALSRCDNPPRRRSNKLSIKLTASKEHVH